MLCPDVERYWMGKRGLCAEPKDNVRMMSWNMDFICLNLAVRDSIMITPEPFV